MKRQIVAALTVLLFVAGCQTTNKTAGQGPLQLSTRAITHFEHYKTLSRPSHFAVSESGETSQFSYCPMTAMASCVDDGGDRILSTCNRRAASRGKKPCRLFASAQEIVWRGPVSVRGSVPEFLAALVRGGLRRTTSFGTGHYSDDRKKIIIAGGNCEGVADIATLKWSLSKCRNGYSATGTFKIGDGNEAFFGFGRDNKGELVEVKVFDSKKVLAALEARNREYLRESSQKGK